MPEQLALGGGVESFDARLPWSGMAQYFLYCSVDFFENVRPLSCADAIRRSNRFSAVK